SVFITLPFFDAEIKGRLKDGVIDGVYIKHLAEKDLAMSFYAKSNTNWRIKELVKKSTYNISGTWETKFYNDGPDTTLAIGNFKQTGDNVTGTFITRTGDYRF